MSCIIYQSHILIQGWALKSERKAEITHNFPHRDTSLGVGTAHTVSQQANKPSPCLHPPNPYPQLSVQNQVMFLCLRAVLYENYIH